MRVTCPNPLCPSSHHGKRRGKAAVKAPPEVLDTPAGNLVCQPGAAELVLQRLQPWEVLEKLQTMAQVGAWRGLLA
jgi:hypothetical protein